MRVAFAHHLSLKYGGGGEKWIVQFSKELVRRGHEVEIYCLPFQLKGSLNYDFKTELQGIKYHEGYFHTINADVAYVTYNPLSWLNFHINAPKVGGMHSQAYWKPISFKYGLLPGIAVIANALTSRWELARFKTIHTLLDEYPISHKNIKIIPNFVDSNVYKQVEQKLETFTVGFASRKNWQKGYDIWEALKPRLQTLNINTVETGNVPEGKMPNFLSQCHVVIVPARVDTFGIVIIESIFCGSIPVVSPLITHHALSLPLFYADTIESCIKRILEVKEMWDVGLYDQYQSILCRQAERFKKEKVIIDLEQMLLEAATID